MVLYQHHISTTWIYDTFLLIFFDNNFVLLTGIMNVIMSKLSTETLHHHIRLIAHYFENFVSHSGNRILVHSFYFLENVVLGVLTIL
jgi:hypothetical protein